MAVLETSSLPPCPHCHIGPAANLAGQDGTRLVTCPCGRSTYGDILGPGWAGHAGDLTGRLEQIRALVETWPDNAQGDKQKILDMIDGKVIGGVPPRTPADKLADAADAVVNQNQGPYPWKALREAIDEYRSTRNGVGVTMAATLGSPPDPVKIARLLLDSLTGGAFSSLICHVMDDVLTDPVAARYRPNVHDNIRSCLRAIGEKIE